MKRALWAIILRELARFFAQRERFFSALVRPLVWLFVFAQGFRAALGLSITPPYQTYIAYETYILPGLCAMILLFSAMQSALALVHDREAGAMRLMLCAPQPQILLLGGKLLASALVGALQVAAFLAVAAAWGLHFPLLGYLAMLPACLVSGLMLGALGLALSAHLRQLESFAGVMNFVIFPMFFMSSALYPLWKMQESSELLALLCRLNPFTHAVELIRFAAYGQWNGPAALWVGLALLGFGLLALRGYEPARVKVR